MTCESPPMAIRGVMMVLLFTAGVTRAAPCVDSCQGMENGDYASCKGCDYFETCSNGLMYTNECQEGLEFDQDQDRCVEAPSSTCCMRDLDTLTATGDDKMAVYVDGVRATPSNDKENVWKESSDYSLNGCNSLIAISCQDVGGIGGILASTTSGMKTDNTWRCTDELETGWETVGFTESDAWGPANAYDTNDANTEPKTTFISGISPSAEWIWYGANGQTIYCRKQL